MAWNANIDMANQISTDVPQIDDNFDHLQTELAHEHDWVVGTLYSGEHLGGSARALQATVAYSDAGLAIAGTAAAADAAQASPYTDRRLLIDSVGRQYYYDDVGGVWKPLCSARVWSSSSNTNIAPVNPNGAWTDYDAANLDITVSDMDDTSGDWIYEFTAHLNMVTTDLLPLFRIYDNTAGAVVTAAGFTTVNPTAKTVVMHGLYRPAASAATTIKIQVFAAAGATTIDRYDIGGLTPYDFLTIKEIPTP